MESTEKSEREYARIDVRMNVRLRLLESDGEAERLGEQLLEKPSVWGPPGETELWKLADSPKTGSDGLMAKALLALAAQIERLNRVTQNIDGPMEIAEIVELSCGGARLLTDVMLVRGGKILLSFMGDDPEVPPVRLVAEVRHLKSGPDGYYGLAFTAVHPADKERLTRFIYHLQRRQLRRAARERS